MFCMDAIQKLAMGILLVGCVLVGCVARPGSIERTVVTWRGWTNDQVVHALGMNPVYGQDLGPAAVESITERTVVKQPSNAISPATIAEPSMSASTGEMDKVNQVIKQLDRVVNLGMLLVVIGGALLVVSFWIPVIGQSPSIVAIGMGMACFFVPTLAQIVREYWWVVGLALAVFYAYTTWQNRRLVLKGAAATGSDVTTGVSKAAVKKAASPVVDPAVTIMTGSQHAAGSAK